MARIWDQSQAFQEKKLFLFLDKPF
jgi:hypothetical protein